MMIFQSCRSKSAKILGKNLKETGSYVDVNSAITKNNFDLPTGIEITEHP